MATITRTTLIAIITLLLLTTTTTVTAIQEPELRNMLTSLRTKGYNLFGNAIITSDIRYELHSGSAFTFFAPTDVSLFTFDMTAPPHLYLSTLRYHVVPGKLTFRELHSLPSATTLQTLLDDRGVTVQTVRSHGSDLVTINNAVHVVVPGLYYSKNVAVHGLNGILDPRAVVKPSPPAVSPEAGVARLTPSSLPVDFLGRNRMSPPGLIDQVGLNTPGTASEADVRDRTPLNRMTPPRVNQQIGLTTPGAGSLDRTPVNRMSPPGGLTAPATTSEADILDRAPENRMSPPGLSQPIDSTTSGTVPEADAIGLKPETSDPAAFPPEFSTSSMSSPAVVSPAAETQPSDLDLVYQPRVGWGFGPGEGYDPIETQLRVARKCKEGSKCDASWLLMKDGGTPAVSPVAETPGVSAKKLHQTPGSAPPLDTTRKRKVVEGKDF